MKETASTERIYCMQEALKPQKSGIDGGFSGIPTRESLLSRLKNQNDDESWQDFFDTYWRLIYNAALRMGLNDAEAQDVVQETVMSVLKSINGFRYDPAKGTFKGWLLHLTHWRIIDQRRKEQRESGNLGERETNGQANDETDILERIPNPTGELEAIWDEEWERNLWAAALDRVKKKVDLKQYQIFDLYVLKEWKVSEVARVMGVNAGQVYLIKHRIQNILKVELKGLHFKPV